VPAATRLRQASQVRNSEAYDDTLTNGPGMESTPVDLENDLNGIRTQLRQVIGPSGNWYDQPITSLSALGTPADNRQIDQPLAGAVNGVNLTYTSATKFRHDGTHDEILYWNGIRMRPGASDDYVVTESVFGLGYDTIAMAIAPHTGDSLTIDFTPV
jgi:hypothetical protein